MRRANQIGNRNPLSQSLSRRPTADKEPEKLWARDCSPSEKKKLEGGRHIGRMEYGVADPKVRGITSW